MVYIYIYIYCITHRKLEKRFQDVRCGMLFPPFQLSKVFSARLGAFEHHGELFAGNHLGSAGIFCFNFRKILGYYMILWDIYYGILYDILIIGKTWETTRNPAAFYFSGRFFSAPSLIRVRVIMGEKKHPVLGSSR